MLGLPGLGAVVLLVGLVAVDGFGLAVDGLPCATPSGDHPLIDLRADDEFSSWHVAGSTSIPSGQLAQRMYELPGPDDCPLDLCASKAHELEGAADLLSDRGWVVRRAALL